jgi:hypothetical protein
MRFLFSTQDIASGWNRVAVPQPIQVGALRGAYGARVAAEPVEIIDAHLDCLEHVEQRPIEPDHGDPPRKSS